MGCVKLIQLGKVVWKNCNDPSTLSFCTWQFDQLLHMNKLNVTSFPLDFRRLLLHVAIKTEVQYMEANMFHGIQTDFMFSK